MALARSTSMILKLAVIAFLGVALWIPVAAIGLLVEERSARRDEVVAEVSSTWGRAQTLEGPVLSVPVRLPLPAGDTGEPRWRLVWAHQLPEVLEVEGVLEPEVRARSLYEVVLWSGALAVRGRFAALDPEALGVRWEDVLTDRAVITIGIGDPTGLREVPRLRWATTEKALEPGVAGGPFGSSLGASVEVDGLGAGGDGVEFDLSLALAGSEGLSVLPVARETRASLGASWPDPSFSGAFLPVERRLEAGSFEARWKVLSLNRDAPQRWLEDGQSGGEVASALRGSAFGVKLLYPVDAYQRTTRSVKYAVLFALLTFLGFFAVEVGCHAQIHPVQYVVIGFALCLFYTLLLALSELMRFDLAYGLAAGAIIGLVTGYARGILRRTALAAWCGGVLAVVYGSLFVMLHLEELALLMGSLLLVVLCAVVMYLTRRLTWAEPALAAGG